MRICICLFKGLNPKGNPRTLLISALRLPVYQRPLSSTQLTFLASVWSFLKSKRICIKTDRIWRLKYRSIYQINVLFSFIVFFSFLMLFFNYFIPAKDLGRNLKVALAGKQRLHHRHYFLREVWSFFFLGFRVDFVLLTQLLIDLPLMPVMPDD